MSELEHHRSYLNAASSANADHLSTLNPEQLSAATHYEGPILVLAGAGSGKTRALTHRIANLIAQHRVAPREILAVTFTNKAADEMRIRLYKLLGNQCERLWVSTFHSAGLRILRRFADRLGFSRDFIVYDDQDSRSLVKSIIKELGIDEKSYSAAFYQRSIDSAKNSALNVDKYSEQNSKFDPGMRCKVYEEYQKKLRQANAMDFGDLLLNTVELFQKHPDVLKHFQYGIRFVLVDEYQDTNEVQYLFLRMLVARHQNVLVVGDDDQSIYAFRGANIRNILEFEQHFPSAKVVKLEQNYRSTTSILECAYAVISKDHERMDKKLWTSKEGGEKVELVHVEDETREADTVASSIENYARQGNSLDKVAIFYRTNAQSRAIEEALIKRSIKYKIFGGLKFFERKEVKDTIAYLRLLLNPLDDQSFLRVVNVPTRGVGAQGLQTVIDRAAREQTSLYEASELLVSEGHSKNKGITEFVNLLRTLREDLARVELPELIGLVIEKSGYVARLQAQDDPTHQSRIENLKELQGLARNMLEAAESATPDVLSESSAASRSTPLSLHRKQLASFLDRATLTAGSDVAEEKGIGTRFDGCVSLMTLHLAKGLEYPCVFLVGLEEGLLPHYRSLEDPTAMEEERRLFYVGITRAMDKLMILHAEKRAMFDSGSGAGYFRTESRFLRDLPQEFVHSTDATFSVVRGGREDDFRVGGIAHSNTRARPELRLIQADNLDTGASSISLKKSEVKSTFVPASKALEFEELSLGLKVQHTVFGKGIIEELSGAEDPDARVVIRFEKFSAPKKLMLLRTKLYRG